MASTAIDGVTFPVRARLPKAAVFLRCQASHVFAVRPLKTDVPAENEVCYIFGPCPTCIPNSVFPHAAAPRTCPFCNQAMVLNRNGRYSCSIMACWFSRAGVETGTPEAVKVWATAYQNETNVYFFGRTKTPVTDRDVEAAKTLLSMSRAPAGNGK